MASLLDGNLLVALLISTHSHHVPASRWFAAQTEEFATCPITEGTLLRLHMQKAVDTSANAAWAALGSLRAHSRHVFWADNFSYWEVTYAHLSGHRQVTDAWLAELARRRGGRVATFDAGFALQWPSLATLVPP